MPDTDTIKCTRCGDCCKTEQCKLSLGIYGKTDEICPALEYAGGGEFLCQLFAISDEEMRDKMRLLYFMDVGICTNDFKLFPVSNA